MHIGDVALGGGRGGGRAQPHSESFSPVGGIFRLEAFSGWGWFACHSKNSSLNCPIILNTPPE